MRRLIGVCVERVSFLICYGLLQLSGTTPLFQNSRSVVSVLSSNLKELDALTVLPKVTQLSRWQLPLVKTMLAPLQAR